MSEVAEGDELRMLTRPEVAELFGVSEQTIITWARIRRLGSVRTSVGDYTFNADGVRAVLARAAILDAEAG